MRFRWNHLAAGAFALAMALHAQVNITSPGFSYTNTFNSLANSGTPTWTDNTTMTGWYAARASGGSNVPYTAYTPGTGSSATGGLYSFGSAASTDRALGSIADTVGNTAYGVRLRNTSGSTITSFTVTYTGEQWRQAGGGGGAANQTLTVAYRISASAITSPDPANTATWTTIAASTFNTPQDARGGSGTALDGNAAANRVADIFSSRITISLPNNSELFIRWFDSANTGNDHGIAIDDVRIYVPEPGTVGVVVVLGAAGLVQFCRSRRIAVMPAKAPSRAAGAAPVGVLPPPAGRSLQDPAA